MKDSKKIKHPAKYTKKLIPVFQRIINTYECKKVLDCFAGVGGIHVLDCETVGLELEEEWARQSNHTIVGDATNMPFKNNEFCAVCTSPTYGNRMADKHKANDESQRNTYTHKIGRELSLNNSGAMQWGEDYKKLHSKAWSECFRVLKNNGILILNVKNHIRKGKEVDVFGWHVSNLINQGFIIQRVLNIPVKGYGFGQNRDLRTLFEYIGVFKKRGDK